MGDVLGSAFPKLRQLEASESPDGTETDPPPEPPCEFPRRPKSAKRWPRFCECACPDTKGGCCCSTTTQPTSPQPTIPTTTQPTTQPTTTQPPTQPTTTTTTTQPTTAEKYARAPAERVESEKRADEEDALHELCSFYGIENNGHQACTLEEPEFIITEMTFDTGATTHAADRHDFPGQTVRESEGSKAGQTFGCAGGKQLVNEGEVHIVMVAPGGIECEFAATVQIT